MIEKPAPLVTDTTSASQATRARRKVRDRAKDEASLLRKQLSTYDGRAFVWRELEKHGVFEDLVGTDAAIREAIGRRREGLRLMAEAGVHGELFHQMWTEGRKRAEDERKEAAAARLADQAEQSQQDE